VSGNILVRTTAPIDPTSRWDTAQDLALVKLDQIIPMKLSKDAAANILTGMFPLTTQDAMNADNPSQVDWTTNYNVSSAIETFQTVLGAELARLNVYHVSAKRAWDMDMLIEHAEVVLSADARALLDAQTVTDVREAGRCIGTGAAQHFGIEDELVDQRLALGKLERLDAQLEPCVEVLDRTVETAAHEPANARNQHPVDQRPERERDDDQNQP